MPFPKQKQIMLCWITLLVGVTAGLGGMFLTFLLHFIQHLAFGYSTGALVSSETFFEGVSAASSTRRVWVLTLCGLVAGFGWFGLFRLGRPLVSITDTLKSVNRPMPMVSTLVHVVLQMVTIGLGSPLGREAAPREFAALIASRLSTHANLSPKEIRIMIACGAGAGLAAVYNVPLGGAVYGLEVLLITWNKAALLPAIASSFIATMITWVGFGNMPEYQVPHVSINTSLVIWSIITGPLFGLSAYGFKIIAEKAHKNRATQWKLPVFCLLNFILIGCLAIFYPSLLGNGKSPFQLALHDSFGIGLATTVLVLHTLIVWSSYWAGAQGGLLTPSLANGALLAVVLGSLWNGFSDPSELTAYALIGAGAFLAGAENMPITALVLIFEFTHTNIELLLPLILAIIGSIGLGKIIRTKHDKQNHEKDEPSPYI